MGKILLYGADARMNIMRGIDLLAKAVSSSLGPAGRNTIIYNGYDDPILTKDGITIAHNIEVEDPTIDAGIRLVKSVARKTADSAGDGTTTATILAQAIYKGGLEAVLKAKANPVVIKRGIDKAVDYICGKGQALDKIAKPVIGDDIVKVAMIAANNDQAMGSIVAEALRAAGQGGVITVEDSKTFETSLERVEGMDLPSGYLSPYFITDFNRQEVVLENAFILIHERKLSHMKPLLPLFEQISKTGRPIFIISESVEGDLIALLVTNRLKGLLSCCAIKAPGAGPFRKELLGDIAALTGGRAIVSDLGMAPENITLADLGQAAKIVVRKDRTIISGGVGQKPAIDARIASIRTQMPLTESPYEKDKLQERLAKLTGGVSIIRLGAASDVELIEKKGRLEDAVYATRAAIEEGIVVGGGVCLARMSNRLMAMESAFGGDELIGVQIVEKAMLEPLKCIAANAGEVGQEVLDTVLDQGNYNVGFNALTGKFEDLMKAGIVDPTKVIRLELQNAASVAGSLLTTEVLIVNESEDKTKKSRLPGRV